MNIKENLLNEFGISNETIELGKKIEDKLEDRFKKLDEIKFINQLKILKAMQDLSLSDIHFNSTTGYGYNDIGREKTEEIFARIFNTEDALVRPNIVNGTHALSICLNALLRNNDTMLAISGKPYDTLDSVIGMNNEDMSLKSYGVKYNQIELLDNGDFNEEEIIKFINNNKTKMVYIQRSKGYSVRKSLTISDIKSIIDKIKKIDSDIIVMIDNCYGEFIDIYEPTDVGADILAGSLIKNPGGGFAISGGYICGREDLIDLCARRLTCNGIGKECGLTFNTTRLTLQGLFISPSVVNSALKGAIFISELYKSANYEVFPLPEDDRSDIIQAIKFNNEDELLIFCEAIQKSAPVDSFVKPIPSEMPGYDSDVIMASGSFIQGSSIELSADGPIRPPYAAYFQGGLTYEHAKLGALLSYEKIKKYKEQI